MINDSGMERGGKGSGDGSEEGKRSFGAMHSQTGFGDGPSSPARRQETDHWQDGWNGQETFPQPKVTGPQLSDAVPRRGQAVSQRWLSRAEWSAAMIALALALPGLTF